MKLPEKLYCIYNVTDREYMGASKSAFYRKRGSAMNEMKDIKRRTFDTLELHTFNTVLAKRERAESLLEAQIKKEQDARMESERRGMRRTQIKKLLISEYGIFPHLFPQLADAGFDKTMKKAGIYEEVSVLMKEWDTLKD